MNRVENAGRERAREESTFYLSIPWIFKQAYGKQTQKNSAEKKRSELRLELLPKKQSLKLNPSQDT